VGEKQLGCGEYDIALLDADNRLRVKLGGLDRTRLHVYRAFRRAGGAGRVEPEAGLVGARRRGGEVRSRCGDQIAKLRVAGCAASRYHDVLKKRLSVKDRLECGQQRFGNDQSLGAAVTEHEIVLAAGKRCVDGDRY